VIFPTVVMPLLVGRATSLAAIEAACATEHRELFLATQRTPDSDGTTAAELFPFGTIGRVLQVARLANGTSKVLLESVERAHGRHVALREGVVMASVSARPQKRPRRGSPEAQLLEVEARRAATLFDEYVALHRRLPAEAVTLVQEASTLERRLYAIAAHLTPGVEDRQRVLAAASLGAAYAIITEWLGREVEMLRLERQIDDGARDSIIKNQREFYLQEQLKVIQRELSGEEGDELAELTAALDARALPPTARDRTRRELRKLARTSPMSPEYTVARNYLDWIAALPWDERDTAAPDMTAARQTLDRDHHGLQEVKERILDYIAVLSLVGHVDGPLLCLVGPPGVGKTSLGRSIARALGRQFVRMSLGGITDEAEIRGHRRTYVGAMPGRVVQAMRRAGVVNPVILLDEVDKLGSDFRGDPAAALLEVLDPEQNQAFNDHYLELDYDLSQVTFITTANSLAGIPEPLRDRLELIRIPGYLDQEKLAIAREHLLPRQLAANGLERDEITLADDVLPAILHGYTREAGVRELERQIARLARKLARRQAERNEGAQGDAEGAAAVTHVTTDQLTTLLGTAPYDPERDVPEDRVGVANGLAYTATGGDTLDVEVSVVRGRGKVSLTGTLGDVMKESAAAAVSYVRARARTLGIAPDFYRTRDIHIHIPDGATPKDGPSGGIAIATAVASALARVPVRGDVAMTGEITLRGRVLPIGGLKEKAVAAHRRHVTDVIIPHANLRDLDDLPAEVRAEVRFHPVKSMDDVLAIALRGPLPSPETLAQRKTRARATP